MTVYTSLIAAANGLITKFGKTVTLKQGTTTLTDNNKPWRGASPSAGATCTPKGVETFFEKEEIDGDRVQISDKKLLVAASDAAIVAASFDVSLVVSAVVDGVTYGATCLEPVKPGAENIVYTIRLRKDG